VGITEFIALVGALVGGITARQRKQELERLNEQLRKINLNLRQQARAGTVYAPGEGQGHGRRGGSGWGRSRARWFWASRQAGRCLGQNSPVDWQEGECARLLSSSRGQWPAPCHRQHQQQVASCACARMCNCSAPPTSSPVAASYLSKEPVSRSTGGDAPEAAEFTQQAGTRSPGTHAPAPPSFAFPCPCEPYGICRERVCKDTQPVLPALQASPMHPPWAAT
jgi:hypothetical protein